MVITLQPLETSIPLAITLLSTDEFAFLASGTSNAAATTLAPAVRPSLDSGNASAKKAEQIPHPLRSSPTSSPQRERSPQKSDAPRLPQMEMFEMFEMPVINMPEDKFEPSGPVMQGKFEPSPATTGGSSDIKEETSRRPLRVETGEPANKHKRWGMILSGDEVVGGVEAVGDEVVQVGEADRAVALVDGEDVVMMDVVDLPPPIPQRSPSRMSMHGLTP